MCLPIVPQEVSGICSLLSTDQAVREAVIYRGDEGKVESRFHANKSLRLSILAASQYFCSHDQKGRERRGEMGEEAVLNVTCREKGKKKVVLSEMEEERAAGKS